MKKLSIVGKDYHTEEQVVGYYNAGDSMRYWGKLGRLLGWPWGMFSGRPFSSFPASARSLVVWPARRVDCRGSRRRRRGRWPKCGRRGACTALAFPRTVS